MSEVIYRDGSYLANNPSWHEEDSPWKARQIIRLLEANRLKPSTICEIGCGAGGILTSMARQMSPTTRFKGYEISPDAFALCASKRASNVQFSLTDLLAEDAEHFDVALAIDVFEHVEDYFSFLRKLKPRATYKVFHIPLDMSVLWTLLKWPIVNGRNRVGHLHYFMKDTALATLRDSGYEIVDYFYTPGGLELPNLSVLDRCLKLPRKAAFAVHQDFTVRLLGGYSLLALAK